GRHQARDAGRRKRPRGPHPGAGQRRPHRRHQGGDRERLVCRAPLGHRGRRLPPARPRMPARMTHPRRRNPTPGPSPPGGTRGIQTDPFPGRPATMRSPVPPDTSRPGQPGGLAALTELAMDLRWSWSHVSDELRRRLDPELWSSTRHPSVVLQSVSREKLARALADPGFNLLLDNLMQAKRRFAATPHWFELEHPRSPLTCVAYFCMEFMLSEALPIYSGGLGNVAGDQLKSASDLGVPVVGVGLLYQRGYFRQIIDQNGAQQELYPYNDPVQLPVTPVRQANGEPLRLEIALPGYSV